MDRMSGADGTLELRGGCWERVGPWTPGGCGMGTRRWGAGEPAGPGREARTEFSDTDGGPAGLNERSTYAPPAHKSTPPNKMPAARKRLRSGPYGEGSGMGGAVQEKERGEVKPLPVAQGYAVSSSDPRFSCSLRSRLAAYAAPAAASHPRPPSTGTCDGGPGVLGGAPDDGEGEEPAVVEEPEGPSDCEGGPDRPAERARFSRAISPLRARAWRPNSSTSDRHDPCPPDGPVPRSAVRDGASASEDVSPSTERGPSEDPERAVPLGAAEDS
jgi:hypothetical protein